MTYGWHSQYWHKKQYLNKLLQLTRRQIKWFIKVTLSYICIALFNDTLNNFVSYNIMVVLKSVDY